MLQDFIPLIVVAGLLLIIIDIKTRLCPKAKLRLELRERHNNGPVDWTKVEASVPDSLGATSDENQLTS